MAPPLKEDTPILDQGVYRPGLESELKGRQDPFWGRVRDTALDLGVGAIDLLSVPYGYGRDIGVNAKSENLTRMMQAGQQSAALAKDFLSQSKTRYGRQEDLNGGENANWLEKAGSAIITSAPSLATAALAGPAMPLAFAALAHGQQSQQFEEDLMNRPREEIEASPVYQKLRGQGLDHDAAVRNMHTLAREDPWAWGPNIAANAIFGGVAAKAVGRIATRSAASTMTQRIIKNVAPAAGEGIIGGAITGAAQEWGAQSGQIGMGTREGYDYGKIGHAGAEMATTLGPLAIASSLPGLRGPKKATPDTTKDLLDAANRKPTPPIGSELTPVAIDNLSDGNPDPAKTNPVTPPVTQTGNQAAPPAAAAGVAPPPVTGGPVDVNGRTGVANGAPFVHSDGQTYQRVKYDDGAMGVVPVDQVKAAAPAEAAAPPAAPPVVAGAEQVSPTVQAERNRLAGTVPEAPAPSPIKFPTLGEELQERVANQKAAQEATVAEQAAAAPPVATAPAFTVDQLKQRAADITQTPDHGTLQKHIKEWQDANPGVKLKEMSEVNAIGKAAREAERLRVKQERDEVAKTEREAKKTAADQAKAETKAQKAKAQREKLQGKDKKAKAQAEGYADLAQKEVSRKQAEGYANMAREQAEKLKAKAKPEVTPEGKPEPKAEPKAEAEPPPEKVKLTLKPTETTETTKPKSGLVKKPAPTVVTATGKTIQKKSAQRQSQREKDQTARDEAARDTFLVHTAGHEDFEGHLNTLSDKLEKSGPEAVVADMSELATTAKNMSDAYVGKINELSGGDAEHSTFNRARKGATPRTGKGEYHNFLINLENRANELRRTLDNLARSKDPKVTAELVTKAKEISSDIVQNMKDVHEGNVGAVAERIRERNAAITTDIKTGKAVSEEAIGHASREEAIRKAEENLDKLLEKIDADQARAKWGDLPRVDKKGRTASEPKYPKKTLGDDGKTYYTHGVPDPLNDGHVDYLHGKLRAAAEKLGADKILGNIGSIFRDVLSEHSSVRTAGEILKPFRPAHWLLRPVFDAVHDMVKDMPVEVWSHDMMEAYVRFKNEAYGTDIGTPLGFYSSLTGNIVLRYDALTPLVVFHEALHAATARALYGSQRLNALIYTLQDYIDKRLRADWNPTSQLLHQEMIGSGERVNPHEFISELFTRPEAVRVISKMNLTKAEMAELQALGYRPEIGRNILKTMWDEFLRVIGFKAETPNAMRATVDMLQDLFEREMFIRETDVATGRRTGQLLSDAEAENLYYADPVGGDGRAVTREWKAGNYEAVTDRLLKMNEKDVLDGKAGDAAIKMLNHINNRAWGGRNALEGMMPPTPPSNPAQVHKGVSDYLDSRFGDAARDLKFQARNAFRTPVRQAFSGFKYTNDIGNTLGDAFNNVLKPIKDAWSRREQHAQEYMNTSGANKLIDDLATLKHEIKDRKLWADFERLLIRESYSKAYADLPLGTGFNEHVKAGELKWRQTETDHAANIKLYDAIKARNPKLIAMRERIFEFSRKELDERLHHQAKDALLRENVIPHGDEEGLNALAKSVRRLDKSMTPAERKAMDRVLGTDMSSKKYKDFVEKRDDIRKVIDTFEKKGPHVPFMRHGKHAVFAEYHITPDAGVKYNEVNPDKTGDLNKMYDFADKADAEHFIDNVLGHKDVQVTVNNAHEAIYDMSTGERARTWSVDKPDGTTKTYTSEAEARQVQEKGDKLRSHDTTQAEIKRMQDDGQPTAQFETRHRVVFNPTEFVRFDSEREATNFRERLNRDAIHPNVTTKVSNVETPKTQISRANVAYTSAELQQWINRIEASPAYQAMTEHQQKEWKREMRVEAARVTMTAGRRTMHLPREYAKGASTDILKNMIDSAGGNARAIAELKYRDALDKGVAAADAYVEHFRNQSGDGARDHRAREESMREIKQRLYAPIQVEGSWSRGIKRALQVSMISHLADTGYLIVNAMEPWIFGASVTAGRHGLVSAYKSLAAATRLVDPVGLAKAAGEDIAAAFKGQFKAADYEKLLLDRVTGKGNQEGDGAGLAKMLHHMFGRGLISRDVGAEVARVHDPSAVALFRGLDRVDEVFRGFNTGIETLNRASMAISNYRLEMQRALKEGLTPEKAHGQAVRYAEDSVFKGAGDYAAWNNPRYFNNPFMKLGLQFKKYPLRIFSVYAEAITKAVQGDKEAMKQVAYMLAMQAIAAGGLGLPLGSFGAGAVNAAYILGWSDDNWDDAMFGVRKKLVDTIGVDGADLVMGGALRFSGADFSAKMGQNSIFFQGSPESRDPNALAKNLAWAAFGAPGDYAKKFLQGTQQMGEAAGHYSAGAHDQAMQTGMQGASNLIQLKVLTNLVKMTGMMTGGSASGLPKGQEASTGQAIVQGLGFTPTAIADKREARQEINRLKKKDSAWRKVWTDRWTGASNSAEQSAIWAQIQKDNQTVDPRLRIKYQDLWKAQQRAKQDKRHDDLKLGVRLSGRQKAFADVGSYFDVGE